MPAVVQIDAAVVSPRTVRPSRMITPAPRNPIPVMIPSAPSDRSRRVFLRTSGTTPPRRLGDEHQRAGRQPDQRVRAKARRASVVAPLQAQRAAQGQRHDQPHHDVAQHRAAHRRLILPTFALGRSCVSLETCPGGVVRRGSPLATSRRRRSFWRRRRRRARRLPGLPVRKRRIGPAAEAQTDAWVKTVRDNADTAAGWWCAARTSAIRRWRR